MKLHLNHIKWFRKDKVHVSSNRSQERQFSFLKGKNGDTKETGHLLTIQDSENLREALFEPNQMAPEEKIDISSDRSQEHPFSFLKGKNGDTKETGHFLTI